MMDIDWDKLVSGTSSNAYHPAADFDSLSDEHKDGILTFIGLFRQCVSAGATPDEAGHILSAIFRANRP